MDYPELSKDAGEQALKDAGVKYDDVEQAFVGYVYGDSTCGQRAVYQLGLTGIPVYFIWRKFGTPMPEEGSISEVAAEAKGEY